MFPSGPGVVREALSITERQSSLRTEMWFRNACRYINDIMVLSYGCRLQPKRQPYAVYYVLSLRL